MEHSSISLDKYSSQVSLDKIPQSCGEVSLGCSDVVGIINAVIASSKSLRSEYDALSETVSALEKDQAKVSDASEEAHLLSEKAIERLGQGTTLIHSSLGQINSLLDLVDTLGQHVTSFAAAMEQVRRSAQDIDQIAETTNILALNATIEAMRAGDAGRTFAVVAGEVKSLANDTRKATEEIAATVDALGLEANRVIGQIEAGADASSAAKSSVGEIERTITAVGELVEEVDRQNDQIARSTGTISGHVHGVQQVLASFDKAALGSEEQLHGARDRMEELEITASDMFDRIVKAGLSPEDSAMVNRAMECSQEIATTIEHAIADGKITKEAVFDQDYVQVVGTNPPQFRTRLSDWADANWRPILDSSKANDPTVMAVACTDMNGFLPTHLTEHSRPPTGDEAHDAKHCRNGRIFWDTVDARAKASSDAYMMAVYRADMDNGNYIVVRNVFVPLTINGQRWGDLELAYSFDGASIG